MHQLITVYDEVGYPKLSTAINQLQELYQKGYIEKPEYNFKEYYDYDGNPVWYCECFVNGFGKTYGDYTSKKCGKKDVAYELLKSLMERIFTTYDEYIYEDKKKDAYSR